MPSNVTRLLLRWGLGPLLDGKVVEPEDISVRRWKNGNVIGYTNLVPRFQDTLGAPYYVVHRAHLHKSMQTVAKKLGARVLTASEVRNFDVDAPSLTLRDGSTFKGDLIVAADGERTNSRDSNWPRSDRRLSKGLKIVEGINSVARKTILDGVESVPLRTGFAAYRATIGTEKIREDSDVSWILEKPRLNLW